MKADEHPHGGGHASSAGFRPCFPSWARGVVVVSAARLPLCALGVLLPGT
jgi:hypothetical protein